MPATKKILFVFGTRPEAVKMCPLIRELRARGDVQTPVCVTGQHGAMLDRVLEAFQVRPDYNLSLMRPEQSLEALTAACLAGLAPILHKERPDLVLVHGDTTSAFSAALAAFYAGIPVGHVEAGLRTYDLTAPYPEEFNRQTIDRLSSWAFAPTETARENLLREGMDPARILVTGNTGLDALRTTVTPDFSHPLLDWCGPRRLILLTAHRRESLGGPLSDIFRAVRRLADAYEDVAVIYPVHPNPEIRKTAAPILDGHPRIRLTEPLDVPDFHNLLARCHFILTDSGGIQEEAAALHKPVLVLRDKTERPEGIQTGSLFVVGRTEPDIFAAGRKLLEEPEVYDAMCRAKNPFGDGFAAHRIADALLSET